MDEISSSAQCGSQETPAAPAIAAPVPTGAAPASAGKVDAEADGFDAVLALVPLAMNPRGPVADPRRLELIAECEPLLDAGLAPLIAAGLVHPRIGEIVRNNLRTALLESSGEEGRAALPLVRSLKALVSCSAPKTGGFPE